MSADAKTHFDLSNLNIKMLIEQIDICEKLFAI